MDKRAIILRCLNENWPDEVSIIGDDLVTRIVDEVLAGNRPVFQVPQGGFSFDLTPYMSQILQAALLLLQIINIIRGMRQQGSTNTNVEDITRKVLLELPDGITVEYSEIRGRVIQVIRIRKRSQGVKFTTHWF